MSGRYLLDTNIIIALFADDRAVKQKLTEAEETFVPSIVIGELCYGPENRRECRRISHALMSLQRVVWCWGVTLILHADMVRSKTGCASRSIRYLRTTFGLRQLRFSTT